MNQFERWLLLEIAYRGRISTVDLWRCMDRGIRRWWRTVSVGKLYTGIERLADLGLIETAMAEGGLGRGIDPRTGELRRTRVVWVTAKGSALLKGGETP